MKNLLKVNGTQKLSKTEQQFVNGGGSRPQTCSSNEDCRGDYMCRNGRCVDYYIL